MLTLTDRCDRCGAQAFIVAYLAACELMFCMHHGRQYMDALCEVADDIYDGTDTINRRPSMSANAE